VREQLRIVFVTAFLVFTATNTVFAESSLSWRVFNKNENTWLYHPDGLMLFSTLSRSLKPVVIDAVRPIDTLIDCIDYDGYLWVSCNAGLYQIDVMSQSVERIALPDDDSIAIGKIAQDADYMWLGTTNKLLRFDKLGREWFVFDLPHPVERIVGLWSNGDEIFCLGDKTLYRFTVSTEKWNSYPLETQIHTEAVFYPGASTFKVIDGEMVYQYQPESYAWTTTNMACMPIGIFDEDSVAYVTDGTLVKKITCGSSMNKILNIPNQGTIKSVSRIGDTLTLATDKRLAKYSLAKETMEFTEYDNGVNTSQIILTVPLKTFNLFISPDNISIYDKTSKAWQHVNRTAFEQKVDVFTWNEEEFALRYAKGYQSKLSGSIQTGISFDWEGYEYDSTYKNFRREPRVGADGEVNNVIVSDTVVDSVALVKFGKPGFLGNINFHSSDNNDRIADVFLNNTSRITAPEKGIYYRGNRNDRLNSLLLGATSSEQIASPLLPEVAMEGAGAIVESTSRLATKDRKVLRMAGGTGYITTKTISQIVPYNSEGKYRFSTTGSTDTSDTSSSSDTLRIVKESCKVFVDGEQIDPSMYNFFYSTGELHFNTLAPIDPASIIVVEYKVQTVSSDNITDIEIIPAHHFGKMHYGALTYSPKDWISAQVGYSGFDRDTLNSVVNVAVPLEWRSTDKKTMLLFRPEMLYNVDNGLKAGGAELKGRFGGKTGFVLNTLFEDSNFVTTDVLSRGYGKVKSEYDVTVTHDILQEVPISYYQHQRFGENGEEDRFSLNAGARFKGLPFLEMNLSRTVVEKSEELKDSVTTLDSLFHIKDKVKLRLYETSSQFLENVTHFYKISYDLTHSESQTEAQGSGIRDAGRISTLSFTLAPIQKIMMSGEVFYRGSMSSDGLPSSDVKPSFNLEMVDAPKGVDVTAFNSFKYSRYYRQDYSTDTLERSVSVVLKPGMWFSKLNWFSPRAKLTQNLRCRFDTFNPNAAHVLSGLHYNESSMLSREVGITIFPVDGLLFTNTNEWAESDSLTSFNTFNKVNYNYDASNTVIAEWNYVSKSGKHTANLSYEKLWARWIRTNATLTGDLINDDMGTTIVAGPKMLIILNVLDAGILKTLSNTHDIDLRWKRHNGVTVEKPDITYSFGLRVKILPNIELQVSNTTFKFTEGVFSDFENSTVLLAYF